MEFRAIEPRPKLFQRLVGMAKRVGGNACFIEAFASGFGPVSLPGDGGPPKRRPARKRSDELSNRLAKRRIAKPKLAMFGFHDCDEALGKCDRRVIAGFAIAFETN
jgi:hypothetical protein